MLSQKANFKTTFINLITMNLSVFNSKKKTTVGEEISLEEGIRMVNDFRETYPDSVPGHYIGKDILEKILNQPGCIGINFRKGLNESGEEHLVYTGVDKDGRDILTYTVVNPFGDIQVGEGIVADRTIWDFSIFTDNGKGKTKAKS